MSEQLGSGLAAWRMPVAELVLPDEVVRWEWKRVRQVFVYTAAQVICSLAVARARSTSRAGRHINLPSLPEHQE